jgi:hypothetical protein
MFPSGLVAKLFAAQPGGIEFAPQGLSGNYMIAQVTGISHPQVNPQDPAFQPDGAFLPAVAQDFSVDAANAARTAQGIKVNQKLVASVTGGGQ